MMLKTPTPEQGRSSENLSFREKFMRIFSLEEIRYIAEHQIPTFYPALQNSRILFRVSNPPKEQTPLRARSWTTDIIAVVSYIRLRSLDRLEYAYQLHMQQPGQYDKEFRENVVAVNAPIIKIVNKTSVPESAIQPGIESNEQEIDETTLNQDGVLIISDIADLYEFQNILLEQLGPESEQYRAVQYKFQEVIEQFQHALDLMQALREDL